jgi:hypothetical protein
MAVRAENVGVNSSAVRRGAVLVSEPLHRFSRGVKQAENHVGTRRGARLLTVITPLGMESVALNLAAARESSAGPCARAALFSPMFPSHSGTLRELRGRCGVRQVLDCANPVGLGRGKRNSPPLRGCSALSASPYSKIPRRSTSRNFQTGSKPERCRRNHGWTRIHTDGVEPGGRWVREARPSFGGRSWTSRIPGSIRVHRCSSVVEFLSVCIDPAKAP